MKDTKAENMAEIKTEALAWFVKLQSGHACQEDQQQLAAWLSQSALHRQEYAKLDTIWSDLDGLDSLKYRMQADKGNGLSTGPRHVTPTRRQFLVGGGCLAASLSAVAISTDISHFLFRDFVTSVGEVAAYTLPDGSFLELDSYSAASLEYSTKSRKLILHHGRAFVGADADAHRPFIVQTNHDQIVTAQAQFSVHKWDENVTIAVTDETVEIMSAHQSRQVLKKGQAASLNAKGDISRPYQMSQDEALSWRSGKLIFEDKPLRQVIADLDRYRQGKIIVTDNALLNLHVSGVFDTHHIENTLNVMDQILPVKLTRLTKFLTIISPASV